MCSLTFGLKLSQLSQFRWDTTIRKIRVAPVWTTTKIKKLGNVYWAACTTDCLLQLLPY